MRDLLVARPVQKVVWNDSSREIEVNKIPKPDSLIGQWCSSFAAMVIDSEDPLPYSTPEFFNDARISFFRDANDGRLAMADGDIKWEIPFIEINGDSVVSALFTETNQEDGFSSFSNFYFPEADASELNSLNVCLSEICDFYRTSVYGETSSFRLEIDPWDVYSWLRTLRDQKPELVDDITTVIDLLQGHRYIPNDINNYRVSTLVFIGDVVGSRRVTSRVIEYEQTDNSLEEDAFLLRFFKNGNREKGAKRLVESILKSVNPSKDPVITAEISRLTGMGSSPREIYNTIQIYKQAVKAFKQLVRTVVIGEMNQKVAKKVGIDDGDFYPEAVNHGTGLVCVIGKFPTPETEFDN